MNTIVFRPNAIQALKYNAIKTIRKSTKNYFSDSIKNRDFDEAIIFHLDEFQEFS